MNKDSDKILTIFIETLELKRYSNNTIKIYRNSLIEYMNNFSNYELNDISFDDNLNFFKTLYHNKRYSVSKMKQIISAVKFLNENIFSKKKEVYYFEEKTKLEELEFQKKENSNKIISKEDMIQFFSVMNNLKHKAILATIYSSGLRISEAVALKTTDINSERMVIYIRDSKGKKDRNSILSKKLLLLLREYFKKYKPKHWLFEGPENSQYSKTSIQKIFKKTLKTAGIPDNFSVHSLRHSFATHMLENGVGIFTIQKLLGHSNVKTTELYTNVNSSATFNIKSPLDNIT